MLDPGSIRASGVAARGRRQNLEDGWCIVRSAQALVAAVVDADGASDTAEPELAAAIEAIRATAATPHRSDDLVRIVSDAVSRAIVASLERRGWRGSCAAIAMVALRADHASVGWVGHCRAYRVRGPELVTLTTDHTVAQALRAAGRPASSHAHLICTRTLGETRHSPEVLDLDLQPGDRIVLLTDGAWAPLGEARIHQLAGAGDAEGAAGRLVAAAHALDASDNAAAIVFEAEGAALHDPLQGGRCAVSVVVPLGRDPERQSGAERVEAVPGLET